jgi:rubrerythrin
MTTYEHFSKAELVETIASEIYAHLATRFAGQPDVAADFRRLAAEEVQHAARIRMLARQTSSSKKLFRDLPRVDAEIEDLLRDAVLLRAEVRRERWGDDLGQIRARLVAWEDHLATAHAECVSRGADPSVSTFFEALAKQDRAHAHLLAPDGTRPCNGCPHGKEPAR